MKNICCMSVLHACASNHETAMRVCSFAKFINTDWMHGWTAQSSIPGGYHGYCLTIVIIVSAICWFSLKRLGEEALLVEPCVYSSLKTRATSPFPARDSQELYRLLPKETLWCKKCKSHSYLLTLMPWFPGGLIMTHLSNCSLNFFFFLFFFAELMYSLVHQS